MKLIRRTIDFIKKMLSYEIIRYGIAGGTVTLTNALTYFILLQLGVVYTTANLVGLILAKVAGYFLNKFFAYKSKTEGIKETLLELIRYVLARAFTGVVDWVCLFVLVEFFSVDKKIGKIVVMLLVIVLNYIIGKKAVFTKKDK